MEKKGYIQVYTGNGKGKTTAAFGLALRAAGRGKRTYMAQFMKKGEYGELIAVKKYLSRVIVVEQFGLPEFHYTGKKVTEEEKKAAQKGIEEAKRAMFSGDYDIVVLDEVNILLYFNIVKIETILEIIEKKPDSIELVLTGRMAPKEILDRADLITEMKEVKHYFQKDVPARLGIEK
jgi:cob(I)alamin adenosyltransferase